MHTTTPSAPHALPSPPRRPYERPRLTVYGPAKTLTQDPQSAPRSVGSGAVDATVLFLGDNA